MTKTLRWGILSTGRIANEFAKGLALAEHGVLAAVASRTLDAATAFAEQYGDEIRAHGSYPALLADPDIDAVYIATPHPMHKEWAIKAAEAGKHILCEKPIAMNAADAEAIIDAARSHGVFLMEAFMYRCHPQTHKLVELIQAGTIGEVRMIQASFGFQANPNPEGRLYKRELGGGAILDIGCYPVSFARLIAGVAQGKPFLDPVELSGSAVIGPTGVDEWTAATLRFPGDILAQVSCSISVRQDNHARVYGTNGHLELSWPWLPAKGGGSSEIVLHRFEEESQVFTIETGLPIYSIEADTVARHCVGPQAPSPAMSWDDTLGNMRTLDRWLDDVDNSH